MGAFRGTLLFFTLLISVPGICGDLDKARDHFKAGLAAFTLGDYGKAALEYEAAYSIEPDPALLYNAAQAHRLAGNKQRALFLYQNYVRYFPNQANRAEVQLHIRNLQAAIDSDSAAKSAPPTDPITPAPRKAQLSPPPIEKPAPMVVEAPRPITPAIELTQRPPEKKKKTPAWVWGVVGGAVGVLAVGLGVGLGLGLSGTTYPNADIGSGRLK